MQEFWLVVGSSANLSLQGTKFRATDIEPEVLDAADLVIDYGLMRWANYGKSSTMINVHDFTVVRHGSCFDLISDVLQRHYDLTLEVPHADNTVVEAWKHITVQEAQLAIEQTEADEDHEALVEELQEMTEKALKKRLKQLYPNSNATKIDKTKGNGIDDRLDSEKQHSV